MKYQEIKRVKRVSTVVVFTAKYLMDRIDSSLAGAWKHVIRSSINCVFHTEPTV